MNKEYKNLTYNPPLEPYLSIVYQDDDIIALDKPSGLLSVPGREPELFDSLATRIREQYPNAQMINRLDKDTSGLVLVSLNKRAHAFIAKQFEGRSTSKLYNAVVWGKLDKAEGIIDLPLGIDAENKPRHKVDYDSGKSAQTKWRVVGDYSPDATRLYLEPLTGRTHQLRVHMEAIGHPILGDSFYAEGEVLDASNRLMLHAERLSFIHPNGKEMQLIVKCPF